MVAFRQNVGGRGVSEGQEAAAAVVLPASSKAREFTAIHATVWAIKG
jgi:hypothetical protein